MAYSTESPLRGKAINEQKIQYKLDSQRGKATLDLADSFIGDEGCGQVAQFVMENPNVTAIMLNGNNIGAEGITQLAGIFRPPCMLKQVSLEWNNIGVVDQGIEVLADVMSSNRTVVSLDLRNNRIGPEGAVALAGMIRSNSTLQRLDLRWNELGPAGGREILNGAQTNKQLGSLEIAGNKIPEELLNSIDAVINKGERKGGIQLEQNISPVRGSASFYESASSPNAFQSSMQTMAANSMPLASGALSPRNERREENAIRYQSQMMAQSKSEGRVGELELQLDQERRRTKELRLDLLKELEQEKLMRSHVEENLLKLKEESMKREMHDNKVIEDLELRLNNLHHETNSQKMDMDKKKEASLRKLDGLKDRNTALNDKFKSISREHGDNIKDLKDQMERQKLQGAIELDHLNQEWSKKTTFVEDSFLRTKTEKEELEKNNQQLRTAILTAKMEHEMAYKSQEDSIRDEGDRVFYQTNSSNQARHDALADDRENNHRCIQDLHSDMNNSNRRHHDERHALEAEIMELKAERNQMNNHLQGLHGNLDHMQHEVFLKDQHIERVHHEKNEAGNHLAAKKAHYKNKREHHADDHDSQKNIGDSKISIFNNKNSALEEQLRNSQNEIARLHGEHENLKNKLKNAVINALGQSCDEHKKFVETKLCMAGLLNLGLK